MFLQYSKLHVLSYVNFHSLSTVQIIHEHPPPYTCTYYYYSVHMYFYISYFGTWPLKKKKNSKLQSLHILSRRCKYHITYHITIHRYTYPITQVYISYYTDVHILLQKCTIHLHILLHSRGAFFAWRAPILSWLKIMCSQLHMLKLLEPSREMP